MVVYQTIFFSDSGRSCHWEAGATPRSRTIPRQIQSNIFVAMRLPRADLTAWCRATCRDREPVVDMQSFLDRPNSSRDRADNRNLQILFQERHHIEHTPPRTRQTNPVALRIFEI